MLKNLYRFSLSTYPRRECCRMFKLYHMVFLALIGRISSFDFADFNAQLARDLAPLQNLGSRISAQVQEDLKPIRFQNDFRERYYNPYLDNLGESISSQVHQGLAPLQNLGQQIQQNVEQSLEPVKALPIVLAMKDGIGGTTIATHSPEGKKFVIRNRIAYECSGSISDNNGECSGNLTPFEIKTKKDHCYFKRSFSIINDWLCLNGNSVYVVNNQITCESNSGPPAILIKLDEFKKLCQGVSQSTEYKYFANVNDPDHVRIPNNNKYVKCDNNQPDVCIFTENNSLQSFSGGTINVSSYNYNYN